LSTKALYVCRRAITTGILAVLCTTPALVQAQFTPVPSSTGQLKNLNILKPPANAKVAIVVFEDLGCPHCAAAHPVELEVSQKYHVPIVRYDCPIRSHVWTFQGAVYARYIDKTYGTQAAETFRGDLFKAQMSLASIDDLRRFTQTWLTQHGKSMPTTVDPDGSLAKQVQTDLDLAHRINVGWTPTLLVVTAAKQQVVMGADASSGKPEDLAPVVQAAVSQTTPAHPAAKPHAR
jgi:protein-disulfide isomerase